MTTDRRSQPRVQWLVVLLALAGALLAPLILPTYALHVLITAFFYAVLASSWALLAGYAGQFSFAHMAFMAIGGYTTGILGYQLAVSPVIGILAGTLLAGLAGLIIGALCLRFRAAYLALFTIAFSEILRAVLRGEPELTRGDLGLQLAPLFGATTSRFPYYYAMLAILVVSLLIMYAVTNSRVGLFLRAIREDEDAAAARGIDVVRYKVLVFVVTSMIAGFTGAFFAHYITIVTPNIFILSQMGLVMAMAIVGGVESLIAAAIGAIIVESSLEVLREFGAWRMVIFGGLVMLTLRFARNGLLAPLLERSLGTAPRPEVRKEAVGQEVIGDGT